MCFFCATVNNTNINSNIQDDNACFEIPESDINDTDRFNEILGRTVETFKKFMVMYDGVLTNSLNNENNKNLLKKILKHPGILSFTEMLSVQWCKVMKLAISTFGSHAPFALAEMGLGLVTKRMSYEQCQNLWWKFFNSKDAMSDATQTLLKWSEYVKKDRSLLKHFVHLSFAYDDTSCELFKMFVDNDLPARLAGVNKGLSVNDNIDTNLILPDSDEEKVENENTNENDMNKVPSEYELINQDVKSRLYKLTNEIIPNKKNMNNHNNHDEFCFLFR